MNIHKNASADASRSRGHGAHRGDARLSKSSRSGVSSSRTPDIGSPSGSNGSAATACDGLRDRCADPVIAEPSSACMRSRRGFAPAALHRQADRGRRSASSPAHRQPHPAAARDSTRCATGAGRARRRMGSTSRGCADRYQEAAVASIVGHRITGNRDRPEQGRGVGWEFVHVCIDGHSRVAFSADQARRRMPVAPCLSSRRPRQTRPRLLGRPRLTDIGSAPALRLPRRLRRARHQAHPHQALHAQNQRQAGGSSRPTSSNRMASRNSASDFTIRVAGCGNPVDRAAG